MKVFSLIEMNKIKNTHQIEPIKYSKNLTKLTRLIVERELNQHIRVGKTSYPKNSFSDIRTYFNSTSQKLSFACLVYANYYDGKPTTTGGAAHRCEINRSSVRNIIAYSLDKNWLEEKTKGKYIPLPIFINSWHNYIVNLIHTNEDLFRMANTLAEAVLIENSDVLPIK